MMDEQLIDEVAQHGVIFNRQKYFLNGSNGGVGAGSGGPGKFETKDEAWQTIAIKLRTDVETCKKRWKYLRERYVSQRKQGDPPVYEHLSRPYLEKMKFLDQHIQPRKSYRNVPSFLTSPHSANSSNYSEYNMDSKSNGSMKSLGHYGNGAQHHYHQQDPQNAMNALSSAAAAASALENGNGHVKLEADQVFRDFAAAVATQQLQQISQSQMHHHQAVAVAAAMADSSQNYHHEHFRDNSVTGNNSSTQNGNNCAGGIPSSSSSMKSPLSSPLTGVNSTHNGHSSTAAQQVAAHSSSSVMTGQMSTHGASYNDGVNDDLDSSTNSNYHAKKPRLQLNSQSGSHISHNSSNHNTNLNNSNASNSHFVDDSDDDSDDNSSSILQPQAILQENTDNHFNTMTSSNVPIQQRGMAQNNNNNSQQQGMFSSNAELLFQLYQQLPHQQQTTAQHQQQQHFNKFQASSNPPQRSSEHLLGELVTTELLKMSKERRKNVQKRILEILFFDD